MAGANYMGGKRNAAKARSKDATSRIQKSFFSRRRLDILSKGLSGKGKERVTATPIGEPGPAISLAHAKRNIEISPLQKCIPSPTRIPQSTPKKKRSNTEHNNSSSSGTSRRSSKVLDALDISEPLFFRAALDRILALPDLACLPERQIRSGVPKRRTSHELVDGLWNKRQKTSCHESENTANDQLSSLSLNCWGKTSSIDQGYFSDLQRDNLNPYIQDGDINYTGFEVGLGRCLKKKDTVTEAEGISSLSEECRSIKKAPSVLGRSSTLWNDNTSTHQNQNQNIYEPETISSLPPSSDQGSPEWDRPDSQPPPFDSSGSSSVPQSRNKLPAFAIDNLYEHRDPWHTIGVILGLSPTSTCQSDNSLVAEKSVYRLPTLTGTFNRMEANLNVSSPSLDEPRTPDHARWSGALCIVHPEGASYPLMSSSCSSPSKLASYAPSATSLIELHCGPFSPPKFQSDGSTDYGGVQVPNPDTLCTGPINSIPKYGLNLTDYDNSDTNLLTSSEYFLTSAERFCASSSRIPQGGTHTPPPKPIPPLVFDLNGDDHDDSGDSSIPILALSPPTFEIFRGFDLTSCPDYKQSELMMLGDDAPLQHHQTYPSPTSATRNQDQETNMTEISYKIPRLKIDRIFQGPCLFPNDPDDSDADE